MFDFINKKIAKNLSYLNDPMLMQLILQNNLINALR
jgi:hypothetical protein